MNTTFDVIVVGVGTMGAATCDSLARRGHSVLGLERFRIPNFEQGEYVPLLRTALTGWDG